MARRGWLVLPASAGRILQAILLIPAFLLAGGCATTDAPLPAPPPATSTAHLVVVNLSSHPWQITASPSSGGAAWTSRIPALASVAADIPAGDYVIEQTLLLSDSGGEPTRRFTARLEAGRTYRWRLATSLPSPGEKPGDTQK